jgi:glutathione reductase (NADPH)
MNEMLHDARDYGYDVTNNGFDWATVKTKRDAYILRLNGIYDTNLAKVQGHTTPSHCHFSQQYSAQLV